MDSIPHCIKKKTISNNLTPSFHNNSYFTCSSANLFLTNVLAISTILLHYT